MLRRVFCLLPFCLSLLIIPARAGAQAPSITFRQWASSATATSQYGEGSWSAMQAAGAPDTMGCGDSASAWASETSTGQDQLTLVYDTPVIPTQINVYETYNPGAITGIELVLADGSGTVAVPDSADPGTICPGIWQMKLEDEYPPVSGVIFTLDQTITGDWNEIDAVELVGMVSVDQTVSVWASSARATSQYGNSGWGAMQVAGPADTPECGDFVSAWASGTPSGQDDLTALFPYAVVATRVDIYETYNPGAITGVDLILTDQSVVAVPDSADPGTPCPGVFSLAIAEEQPIMGVVIHLDQSITGTWNEIDAVQVTGTLTGDLIRQWASGAEASSQYGDTGWSAAQAAGAPNATDCGDYASAWASESPTGQDTLSLSYDTPVVPMQVTVYQTHSPGAITGIELVLADGSDRVTVPDSAAPDTTCPGVFVLDLPPDLPPVSGVIITVDQSLTGSWNEIDAVELVGQPVTD